MELELVLICSWMSWESQWWSPTRTSIQRWVSSDLKVYSWNFCRKPKKCLQKGCLKFTREESEKRSAVWCSLIVLSNFSFDHMYCTSLNFPHMCSICLGTQGSKELEKFENDFGACFLQVSSHRYKKGSFFLFFSNKTFVSPTGVIAIWEYREVDKWRSNLNKLFQAYYLQKNANGFLL